MNLEQRIEDLERRLDLLESQPVLRRKKVLTADDKYMQKMERKMQLRKQIMKIK